VHGGIPAQPAAGADLAQPDYWPADVSPAKRTFLHGERPDPAHAAPAFNPGTVPIDQARSQAVPLSHGIQPAPNSGLLTFLVSKSDTYL